MTQKCRLVFLSIFAAICFDGRAGTNKLPASVSATRVITVTASASAVSQYVYRGQRRGGPSFQPSIELGAGDLVLGVWTNFPIKNKVSFISDPEVDFYGSYNFAIDGRLSLTPGFICYVYPNAPTGLGYYRSTFEPSLALDYTISGVRITPKLSYDMAKRGAVYELDAVYAIPLAWFGTELDFYGNIGTYYLRNTVNGATPDVKAWGDYWLISAAVPYQFTQRSKITLGWAYTQGSNAYSKTRPSPKHTDPLAAAGGVVTITYAVSF